MAPLSPFAEPSLSFWVVGVVGLVALDVLRSAVASRKKREPWPVWKQAPFYPGFCAISVAWILAGSELVHGADMKGIFKGHGAAVGSEAAGVIFALLTDQAVLNHAEYKARRYAS